MIDFARIGKTYAETLLEARDTGFRLREAQLTLIEGAFRDAVRALRAMTASTDPLTAERAASLQRQLESVLHKLGTEITRLARTGRSSTISRIVAIHQRAVSQLTTQFVGRNVTAIAARMDVAAVRAATALAARERISAGFVTLISRHLEDAAPALDRLLVSSVARGVSIRRLTTDVANLLRGRIIAGEPYGMGNADVSGLRTLQSDAARIARTETLNALREGNNQALEAGGIVLAAKWQLSGNHNAAKPDVCDVLARIDFYGFGEGYYPPSRWPLEHPNGACYQGGPVKFRPPTEWASPLPPAPPLLVSPAAVEMPAILADAWTPEQLVTVRARTAAQLAQQVTGRRRRRAA